MDENMTELRKLLIKLGACSQALDWLGDRNLEQTWNECERADWLIWLCERMAGKKGWPTRKRIVLTVCECADLFLPVFEKKYPKDKRVRKCIRVTRQWAQGKASSGEVRLAIKDAANAHDAAIRTADDGAAYTAYIAYRTYYPGSWIFLLYAGRGKKGVAKLCLAIIRKKLKPPFPGKRARMAAGKKARR